MSYHLTFTHLVNGNRVDLDWESVSALIKNMEEYIETIKKNKEYSYILSLDRVEKISINYSNGIFWVERPKVTHIDFLVKIADRIGCRLVGDEGEVYFSSGEYYYTKNAFIKYKNTFRIKNIISKNFHIICIFTLVFIAYLVVRVV